METVEVRFNNSELSVRSWAFQLSISHLQFIHPYDFIKIIHHCSLNQDRSDPESNFSEWMSIQWFLLQWQETE